MPSARIYVGHLSHRVRETDIEDFFSRYGRVREVLLKNGFGFVEFDDPRDAEEAVYRCNGKELRGERIIVEITKRPPRGRDPYRNGGGRSSYSYGSRSSFRSPTRNPAYQYSQTKYKLRVKNLSSRYSWQDLKDMFRTVGEVMYADAHREKKNEGIVCFACYADLKKAKDALDGKEYNGRRLELIEVSDRSRSRSRGSRRSTRSRSRSRSRSSRSRSPSKSRSKSRSKSKGSSRSRSKSPKRSRSKSRSASPRKSIERNGGDRGKSASRSVSRSRSRSGSRDAKGGTSPGALNGAQDEAAGDRSD